MLLQGGGGYLLLIKLCNSDTVTPVTLCVLTKYYLFRAILAKINFLVLLNGLKELFKLYAGTFSLVQLNCPLYQGIPLYHCQSVYSSIIASRIQMPADNNMCVIWLPRLTLQLCTLLHFLIHFFCLFSIERTNTGSMSTMTGIDKYRDNIKWL